MIGFGEDGEEGVGVRDFICGGGGRLDSGS